MGLFTTPRVRHYAIISRSSEPQILLIETPAGWALPHCTSDERHTAEVDYINKAVSDQLGIDVTLLRCVRSQRNPVTGDHFRIHALESHRPNWKLPPKGRWMRRHELAGIPLAHPEHRSCLKDWLREREERCEPLDGRDWTVPGWWDRAIAWIEHELLRVGVTGRLTVEQIRTWEFSCMLRVHSTDGEFYFKALPRTLTREVALTRRLAEVHPQWMPEIVVCDMEQRWMLMKACRGAALEEASDIASWERAMEAYAQMQIEWSSRTQELIALGCPERTLEMLEQAIDPLLANTALMLPGHPDGLSGAQIARLRELTPELKAMCHELGQFAIPLSLDHGDFWVNNIFVSDQGCAFIDWEDGRVAHPFFSLLTLMLDDRVETCLSHVPDAPVRLRNAYLAPWTTFEPMDRLLRAFDMAQKLSALQHAISFQYSPSIMQVHWWMETLIPWFLKFLVADRTALP
jgi:Phosphotransferase enzyme family